MENRKDTTRNLACLKLPFRPSFVGRPRPSVRPSVRNKLNCVVLSSFMGKSCARAAPDLFMARE